MRVLRKTPKGQSDDETSRNEANTTKTGKQQARSAPKDRHQTISTVGICHEDIATAAYYRAQSLGFSPGNELIDWLEAERQTNAAVKKNRRAGLAVE